MQKVKNNAETSLKSGWDRDLQAEKGGMAG